MRSARDGDRMATREIQALLMEIIPVYGELLNRPESSRSDTMPHARHLILLIHLIVTLIRLLRPGGIRAVVAESVFVKHQLLILNRSRKRAPNLRPVDRIVVGICALMMCPARGLRSAIAIKPSTLLHFHHALVKRKYRF